MGICAGKSQQKENLVTDIESIPILTQGILEFNVKISGIKVKMDNLPAGKISMKIGEYDQFETECSKELYGKLYFKQTHAFQMSITEEQLKKQYLNVTLMTPNNENIASIQINLFLIATGPQHMDYEYTGLINKKQQQGKISFDFKIAQIIKVNIVPQLMEFNMNEPLIHSEYYYSLKMVTSALCFQSEHSDAFLNPAYQKNQLTTNNSAQTKQQVIKQIMYKQCGVEMTVEVPLIEISSSSIQVCLWYNEQANVTVNTTTGMNKSHYTLLAETYFNLNQIFTQALNSEQICENNVKVYKILYQQTNRRLWNHGVLEGNLNCNLQVIIPTYLNQQIVGVRTDKGIQQGSSVVNSGKMPVKEIQQLSQAGQQLLDLQYKIQNCSSKDLFLKSELKNSQIVHLRTMQNILKQSDKQSIICFEYKSQQDLFNAQKLLIEIAQKLLESADQQEEIIREEYYILIKLILNRGELSLNQVGFSEETEKTSEKLLKFKTEIGLNYQSFLYKCLGIVLQKLKQKSLAENERGFVEHFFASAYFKIPEFRTKIIESVQRTDDPQIPEWRSLTKQTDEITNKEFNDLFDWNRHFYEYLTKQPKYNANINKLMEIINQEEWQKRIGKRGIAFFFFLKEWCDLIDISVVVKQNVPYQQLPGYNVLIKAMLLEMKAKELKNYPDIMKAAMCSLLNNTSLLNIVIVILFNKTNLFDSDTLLNCLEILNSCLQYLCNHKLSMPTSLDQQFFLKGIRMILLQCEHAFSVSKCLWLIYNNYVLFPLDIRKDLTDLLFENVATKFFMHWSFNIRMIFHHILLYRIQHLHKSNKNLNEEDLIQKYQQQVKPKKQHSFFDQKNSSKAIISDVIYMKFFRFMQQIEEGKQLSTNQLLNQMIEETHFHKQMKTKLIKKRIQDKKKVSSDQNSSSDAQSYRIIDEDEQDIAIPLFTGTSNELKPQIKLPEKKVAVTQNQLKYLIKACSEFEELKYKYQKWKQSVIPVNFNSLSEDEKINLNETFKVPEVKLAVPLDEKEGNIKNTDEW
ncbi:unnamed protein product [Paramecium pentaurelia]|uniref:Uncharacterized protein n=1 Tax=Paramecium pentaurelia TaxID=43138 RepID=A0A8S1U1M1_9CILI|nr:unnamed protein product [Paramecium pentaurelia]